LKEIEMRRFLLLGLIASGSASAVAQPLEPQATVYVKWAHGPQDYVIIDEDLWRCAQDRCSGVVLDRGNLAAWTCRKIHRAAGTVNRFVLPTREFTEAELQQCNR
jgi:hypothetical protein